MTAFGVAFLVSSALCTLIVMYPYLLYPSILRVLPPAPPLQLRPSENVAHDASQFSILFSAFNEERCAHEKLANLRSLVARYADLEVRIFDDGSTDRTGEIFAALGPNVVRTGRGRAGKATGIAELVASTERPLVLFTDANVILDEGVIDRAARYFTDPSVGGVCGHLEYWAAEKTATQAAGGAYWRLEEHIKRLESRTGNVMGGDGSIFVMRRDLYPAVPATAQDDFTSTMNVVFSGLRLIIAEDVIAREQLVASTADEYRRKVRIAARAMHTHLMMRSQLRRMPALDRWKYLSHKVLRWYGMFFLSGGVVCGMSGLFMLDFALGLAATGVVVVAALLIGILPWFGPVKEVLIAIAATGQGVLLALRGATYATWTPPQSR